MKKIKVLRIINRFNIGGPTYNAAFLSAFLDDKYETLLIGGLPEEGESDSLYILEKYGVKPMLIEEMKRTPNPKSDFVAYKRIKEIIKDFEPDIVHTHASKAGALGRKAAASCKVPIIVHTYHGHVFHSYFGKVKTNVFKSIERKLAKKSTAIVAISDIQKKELGETHQICESDKIKVVPLGFDLLPFKEKRESYRSEVRSTYNIAPDEVAIAIVGRLAPIKNHDFFLDVIEQVNTRITKKLKCFIVGDGDQREHIQKRVSDINSKHSFIEMTSWIEDIGKFNSAMDVICLTSNNEGTPVSLIEAQAGGIPVITSEVGGVRDIVDDGNTGYVIPVGDIDTYVDRLVELIENEKIREKMSQNGWPFVQDKFHYNTLVRNVENLYNELLKNR